MLLTPSLNHYKMNLYHIRWPQREPFAIFLGNIDCLNQMC